MFNRSRIVLNFFRPFENTLLDNSKILTAQQKRTTFIVKRRNPVPLHKKSGPRYGEKLKHRHFIYDVVERPGRIRQNPLDVILLQYVDGIGEKGDRVTLKPTFAYNKLLLPRLAVYASPENIAKFERQKEDKPGDRYSSIWVERTLNILSTLVVSCYMNIEVPWVLEKWHVRVSLRRAGIICPLEAITMPEKTISGPNLEIQGKEFYVTITINNKEEIKVRCRIHHFHTNPEMKLNPSVAFSDIPEAIFPEDKEILDSMPRFRRSEKKGTSESLTSS